MLVVAAGVLYAALVVSAAGSALARRLLGAERLAITMQRFLPRGVW